MFSNFMDRLTSKTLIQTNATIIAGLLVLTTLQSLSVAPILEQANNIDQNLDDKQIEIAKRLTTIEKIKSDLITIPDENRREFYQEKIDELTVELYLLEEETNRIARNADEWFSTTMQRGIIESIMGIRLVVLLMIMPFAASIITEIYPSKHERETQDLDNNEKATKIGKFFLCVGCIALIIGLGYIITRPLL